MTQRWLHYQSSPQRGWGDSSQSWEPGAHYTALGKLDRPEGVLPRHLSWFEPLRGSSAGLCLFWELIWSESVSQHSLLLLFAWGGENLMNLIRFRDFLTLLNCLLPELN